MIPKSGNRFSEKVMLKAAIKRIGPVALLAVCGALLLGAASGAAAPLKRGTSMETAGGAELSAQSRPRRARPQLRVVPRYPYRRYHSPYPLPYDFEYPGPNAVRHCVDWYAAEHRPSGTVIVPRMRCWWERG
jgi:hypothetical protein